jgi:hypothetical protein
MLFVAGETLDSHLYEVWLDGVRQPLAVRADSRVGYVTSYRVDRDGRICREFDGRPSFATAHGSVEIRLSN